MKIQFLITILILGSSFFTGVNYAKETLSDTEKSIIADVDTAFEQQLSFLEK